MKESFSKYSIVKRPSTWQDRYVTKYLVQFRTRGDGVILHEEGSYAKFSRTEFSTLEVES